MVVSHSRALAEAAIGVAAEMVPGDACPVMVAAAGLDEGGFGTDAARVAEALGEADSGEGVLVLADLGSAVLSAEMGLEFCPPELAGRVTVSPAPLVEGLVAAVVAAASGAGLAECDARARRGLAGKQEHLDAGRLPPRVGSGRGIGDDVVWSTTVDLPQGLHARPAAAITLAVASLDARVLARNPRTGAQGDATSPIDLMGLDLRSGDTLQVRISGPDAEAARVALAALAARRFGDA